MSETREVKWREVLHNAADEIEASGRMSPAPTRAYLVETLRAMAESHGLTGVRAFIPAAPAAAPGAGAGADA